MSAGFFSQYGPGDYDFQNLVHNDPYCLPDERYSFDAFSVADGPVGMSVYNFPFKEFDLKEGDRRVEDLGFLKPATLWGEVQFPWAKLDEDDQGWCDVSGLHLVQTKSEDGIFYYDQIDQSSSLSARLDGNKDSAQLALVLDPALTRWFVACETNFEYHYPDGAFSTLRVLGSGLELSSVPDGNQPFPASCLEPVNQTGEVARWTVTGAPVPPDLVSWLAEWEGSTAEGGRTSATARGFPKMTLSPGGWDGTHVVWGYDAAG